MPLHCTIAERSKSDATLPAKLSAGVAVVMLLVTCTGCVAAEAGDDARIDKKRARLDFTKATVSRLEVQLDDGSAKMLLCCVVCDVAGNIVSANCFWRHFVSQVPSARCLAMARASPFSCTS